MTLLNPHETKLRACGLTPATWAQARLHSGSADEVREILGYGVQGGGLVIPYDETYARVRIDNPGPDGRRYRSPKGQGNRLYVPPTIPTSVLTDPSVPLYVTEGEFKVRVLKNRSGPAPKTVTLHFEATSLRVSALPIRGAEPVPAWVTETVTATKSKRE